ncbi:MAG: hypothetical protein GY928_23250 [Colwellia sp.]|nr:hypothetical protein [Colwellia sp.]
MKTLKKFAGQREVVTKFAWLPTTLTLKGTLDEHTVLWEEYKVEVVYETGSSLWHFMQSPDGGFTRPLVQKVLWLVH